MKSEVLRVEFSNFTLNFYNSKLLKTNNMKKYILLTLLFIATLCAKAGATDTIKVMQYNLLNYGNYTDYCTQDLNNINDKNRYIRTILTAYYPDIFTVCEMGRATNLPSDFVNNNLNINGITCWKAAAGSNSSNSYLTNCAFYNSEKLVLRKHTLAQNYIRDVDIYSFYLKNSQLASGDTVNLVCIVAHLKAGYGEDNEEKRRTMCRNIMNNINNTYRNCNVLIMGDFNLYTSQEAAYQTLTNKSTYPTTYFIDPVYPYGVGDWNNNPDYKDYHTQSTDNSGNGCRSGGGMDDRFDFILMSNNIYGGADKVLYINGSYHALGQDGNHFNQSINTPANQNVSTDVANALFNNSDHLPVTMKLLVTQNTDVEEISNNELHFDIYPNPAKEIINIRFYQNNFGKANINIFNSLGQLVYSNDIMAEGGVEEIVVPVENLRDGLYFLRISNGDGISKTIKITKR